MTDRSEDEMSRDLNLNALMRLDQPSNSQDTHDDPQFSDQQMINELRVQMLGLLETQKAVTASASALSAISSSNAAIEDGRYCWVCFATDEDDKMAAWVQPCKCSGTTKWVHQV